MVTDFRLEVFEFEEDGREGSYTAVVKSLREATKAYHIVVIYTLFVVLTASCDRLHLME
jgi:hypothetical protein